MRNEKLKDPRKRKMLLVLPLLIIPFLTMVFWALGGGKVDASSAQKQATGLNLQLPNAQLKDDKGENKLSYYEQAEKESAKLRGGMENDPFFQKALPDSLPEKISGSNPYPLATGDYKDPNEQKVYQKLAELNSHLQNPNSYSSYNQKLGLQSSSYTNSSFSKENEDRLEDMMRAVSSPTTKDPEMEQLNGMMERILDIQHPERVKQRLNENTFRNKEQVYPVNSKKHRFSVSLLETIKSGNEQSTAFYGIDDDGEQQSQNAIEAVIHETKSLVNGSIVKMRLLNDVVVDEITIPKGSFVFGIGSLQGERLHVEINSIRKDNSLYPVKLVVYDLDGLEGVHIPGAITRDVAKQSADNSLQNIEISSIDPSLKAQATTAGINAAKSLLTKKAKLVKVTLKAGYKILLKEKSQQ
jgi:conjugative transposon TraM protein